MLQAKKASYMP